MKKIIIFLLLTLPTSSLFSQHYSVLGTVWDVTTGAMDNQTLSHSSVVTSITDNADPQTSKMFFFDVGSLFHPGADRTGGIIAERMSGNVTLTMWSLKPGTTERDKIIYRISLNRPSETYGGTLDLNNLDFLGRRDVTSDVLALSGNANIHVAFDAECKEYSDNFLHNFFVVNTGKYFMKDIESVECLPEKHFSNKQPVIIELTMVGAGTVNKLKVPGVGEMTPLELLRGKPEMDFIKGSLIVKKPTLSINWQPNGESPTYDFSTYVENVRTDKITVEKLTAYIGRRKVSAAGSTPEPEAAETNEGSKPYETVPFDIKKGEERYIDFGSIVGRHDHNSSDPAIIFADIEYVYKLPAPRTYARVTVPATFKRTLMNGQQDVYTVDNTPYLGIPIYKLSGGMSAEFAVEKSLAALAPGISHTWAVRDVDGKPDLKDGGPRSVFSTPDFLDKSVRQTVRLYNDMYEEHYNDRFYKVKTVIIGPGVFAAPYLSSAMKAPVLPIHFLAAQNTVKEVRVMVNYANDHGYKAYATLGYDPSMQEEAVAWIKLLELPEAYKQFLIDHQVEEVIFLGMNEDGLGEATARRFDLEETHDAEMYAPRSIYLMRHNQTDNKADDPYYKRLADLDDYKLEAEMKIADWESGMPQVVIDNFSNSIKSQVSTVEHVLSISSAESEDTYNLGTLFALKSLQKNNKKASDIKGVSINEYLIGFPAAEAYLGMLPFLYLQFPGLEDKAAERLTKGFLQPNVLSYDESFKEADFKSKWRYSINAKANRNSFETAFMYRGLEFVTQNHWQKADVWDPSDGMNSPSEMMADQIAGRYEDFKNWVRNSTALGYEDLITMVNYTTDKNPEPRYKSHPTHKDSTRLFEIQNVVTIDKYEFESSPYWKKIVQPNRISVHDYSYDTPEFIGYMDGKGQEGVNRSQSIVISQFDFERDDDDFDLRIGYKFNPSKEDGFDAKSADGEEQVMDCFEYVRIPHNDWLEIPSRMMEKNGALWIVNGSVYDWDYNGLPGVVPFIKKDGVIKAQPQILSFKGEAAFGWNWGQNKEVDILARPKEIPATGLANTLKGLYSETSRFRNVLAGMTYMTNAADYDIKALQPQWMLDYPKFSNSYVGGSTGSGLTVRCVLANPGKGCETVWAENYAPAPLIEGWNDCSKLQYDDYIRRFSALAYQQYDQLFDFLPNSRTFVALKGKKLDIGIVDGEMGQPSSYAFTKRSGMTAAELSDFMRYKNYDKLVNLDGGSSSQIWLNGRGPLHIWDGYPLKDDNQGPYFSRLVSSFIMLVPKLKSQYIKQFSSTNNSYLLLDNSARTFHYSDSLDHSADKAFVSLGPSLPLLDRTDDPEHAVVAANFRVQNVDANGAILYYIGEDMHYEDTEGKRAVIPRFRNATIVGVGQIPDSLRLALSKMKTWEDNNNFNARWLRMLNENNQAFYYLRTYDGKVQQFYFHKANVTLIDNNWHSFVVWRANLSGDCYYTVMLDDRLVSDDYREYGYCYTGVQTSEIKIKATHAAIGAANYDGRFITGNAKLNVDNFLLVTGKDAMSSFKEDDLFNMGMDLYNNRKLSQIGDQVYYLDGVYAFQFEESGGYHSTSAYYTDFTNTGSKRAYGLNLNTQRVAYSSGTTSAQSTATIRQQNDAVGTGEKIPNQPISIFPNPTTGNLYVNIAPAKAGTLKFEVYDYLGRQVMTVQKFAGAGRQTIALDISSVKTQGTYVLKISNEDGSIQKTQSFMYAK